MNETQLPESPSSPKPGIRRPGAGRKTAFPRKRQRTLSLTDEAIALAKQIGHGNTSDGIERALRAYVERHPMPVEEVST